MSDTIQTDKDLFQRLWCASNRGQGVDHRIICPKCLSEWWVDSDYPTCAKCDYMDIINHKTCLEGKCTNGVYAPGEPTGIYNAST